MKTATFKFHEHTKDPNLELSFPVEANAARLGLVGGEIREMTQVTVGRDYLKGFLEDSQSIGLIRLSEISRLEFDFIGQVIPQRITWSRKTLSEQIKSFSFPRLAKISTRDQRIQGESHWLLGATRGFLIFQGNPNFFIPLSSVGYLELGCG
jgi:hypothetical protein